MAPWSGKAARLTLVIWGTLEILLFAGLIFGWASLVYVFKLEGYFSQICIDEENARESQGTNTSDQDPGITLREKSVAYKLTGNLSTDNGVYNNISNSTWAPSSCKSQDEEFNLVYTLAVVITGVSLFATGWMFDKWGTRVCRLIGLSTYLLGSVLTAFSTPATSVILYPGIILLVFGGYFFLMTNFQLGNLMPSARSTIISLYCGAYDSSAFMLVLVKWAYEAGISTQASFLFLSAMLSMVFASTFWFMPKGRIPHPLPPGYKIDLLQPCYPTTRTRSRDETDTKNQMATEDDNLPLTDANATPSRRNDALENNVETLSHQKEKEDLNDRSDTPLAPSVEEVPSFWQIARTSLYMLDVFWLVCHRFASWSFVGRLNPALNRLAGGDKALVSRYTSVYASLQFFGIFIAPLSGCLMDRKKSGQTQTRADKVEMSIASFVLDCTIGLALSITTCIPILEVQYASFVLHVLHRACLYGPNSAFIAQAFPVQHFGKLFGFAMSFAGAISLLQYPLFLVIQSYLEGDPLMANIVTVFLMVVSYAHPVYIWYWCRQQKRRRSSPKDSIYIPAKTKEEEAEGLHESTYT